MATPKKKPTPARKPSPTKEPLYPKRLTDTGIYSNNPRRDAELQRDSTARAPIQNAVADPARTVFGPAGARVARDASRAVLQPMQDVTRAAGKVLRGITGVKVAEPIAGAKKIGRKK